MAVVVVLYFELRGNKNHDARKVRTEHDIRTLGKVNFGGQDRSSLEMHRRTHTNEISSLEPIKTLDFVINERKQLGTWCHQSV